MLSRDKLISHLSDSIPNGHQLIGTTKQAFEYLVSKTYRRLDAIYRLHYDKTMRGTDRFRLKHGGVTDNLMRDRLVRCGFIEVFPGIWTRETPSVSSPNNQSPNV